MEKDNEGLRLGGFDGVTISPTTFGQFVRNFSSHGCK